MRTMVLSWSLLSSISLIVISLFSFCYSNVDHPSISINNASSDIHDILPDYNLPKGIIPNAVKSYSISSQDGSFTVQMEHPCYVKFLDDQIVYYDQVIKGKLSYGTVSHVSGIQAKKFFVWLPVTGMEMDTDTNMVEFYVGALSQKLPAKQFETIPTCMNKACFGSAESDLKLRSFWVNYYF